MIVKLLLVFEIMLVNLCHQDYEPILFIVNNICCLGLTIKVFFFCFVNQLLLCARFFIHRCKYSKSKPDMLQYFNLINLVKKAEYVYNRKTKQ